MKKGGQGGRNRKEKKQKGKKKRLYVADAKKGRLGIPRNTGKLDDWKDWKLWKCGRLGKIIIREAKLRRSWNP